MEKKPEIIGTELNLNNTSDPHIKVRLPAGIEQFSDEDHAVLLNVISTIVNLVLGMVFRKRG